MQKEVRGYHISWGHQLSDILLSYPSHKYGRRVAIRSLNFAREPYRFSFTLFCFFTFHFYRYLYVFGEHLFEESVEITSRTFGFGGVIDYMNCIRAPFICFIMTMFITHKESGSYSIWFTGLFFARILSAYKSVTPRCRTHVPLLYENSRYQTDLHVPSCYGYGKLPILDRPPHRRNTIL